MYQVKFEPADSLMQEALAIRLAILPPLHPDLGESYHGISLLHYFQGQYAEAIAAMREQLAGLK